MTRRSLRSTRSETLFLSAITVGRLDDPGVVYAYRILPIDHEVATSWGRLMAERSRPSWMP